MPCPGSLVADRWTLWRIHECTCAVSWVEWVYPGSLGHASRITWQRPPTSLQCCLMTSCCPVLFSVLGFAPSQAAPRVPRSAVDNLVRVHQAVSLVAACHAYHLFQRHWCFAICSYGEVSESNSSRSSPLACSVLGMGRAHVPCHCKAFWKVFSSPARASSQTRSLMLRRFDTRSWQLADTQPRMKGASSHWHGAARAMPFDVDRPGERTAFGHTA